jgi:hypothetical protein
MQAELRYTKGAKVTKSQYDHISLSEEAKRALSLIVLPDN